jgi:hypothetical protein
MCVMVVVDVCGGGGGCGGGGVCVCVCVCGGGAGCARDVMFDLSQCCRRSPQARAPTEETASTRRSYAHVLYRSLQFAACTRTRLPQTRACSVSPAS